jgi:homocysteine S-methyltransferase
MRNAFLATLDERPLLCDGALGTLLHERGVPADACLEAVSLEEPSLLLQVHSDYIEAGADIIETNTFAPAAWLGPGWRAVAGSEPSRRGYRPPGAGTTARPVFAGAVGPLDVGLPAAKALRSESASFP